MHMEENVQWKHKNINKSVSYQGHVGGSVSQASALSPNNDPRIPGSMEPRVGLPAQRGDCFTLCLPLPLLVLSLCQIL